MLWPWGLFPRPVFVVQRHCLVDGFLLPFLGAATKQNNQGFAIFGQVDAIIILTCADFAGFDGTEYWSAGAVWERNPARWSAPSAGTAPPREILTASLSRIGRFLIDKRARHENFSLLHRDLAYQATFK